MNKSAHIKNIDEEVWNDIVYVASQRKISVAQYIMLIHREFIKQMFRKMEIGDRT
jgi:hypothetical protein